MVGFVILDSIGLNLCAKILGHTLGLLKEPMVLKCEIYLTSCLLLRTSIHFGEMHCFVRI